MPLEPLAGIPYPTLEGAAADGMARALEGLSSGEILGGAELLEAAWMYAGEHLAVSPLEAPYRAGYLAGLCLVLPALAVGSLSAA